MPERRRRHFAWNREKTKEASKEAGQCSSNHYKHEGQIEKERSNKSQCRERNHELGSQHLSCDSDRRLNHDDQDGWL